MRQAKWFLGSVLVVALLVTTALGFGQFNRTISVTGGSAQRLSTVLASGGYSSPETLDELTICNPAGAANTLYLGQSDVDASNGFPLLAGECKTERAVSTGNPVQSGQIYLFTATTQSAAFSVRSK